MFSKKCQFPLSNIIHYNNLYVINNYNNLYVIKKTIINNY